MEFDSSKTIFVCTTKLSKMDILSVVVDAILLQIFDMLYYSSAMSVQKEALLLKYRPLFV